MNCSSRSTSVAPRVFGLLGQGCAELERPEVREQAEFVNEQSPFGHAMVAEFSR
jgi:hypothetical protein